MWVDAKYVAFDLETSGTLPEYALQPWRVAQGKAWITSIAIVHAGGRVGGQLLVGKSAEYIGGYLSEWLQICLDNNWTIVGWNVPFDISWLIAYGCGDLVAKLKWLDGMLLWKHLTVEPEYDLDRSKKKSYGLKTAVAEYIPMAAGYEEGIDFHSTDPAELAKLHQYNIADTTHTLALTHIFYNELAKDPQRLKAALIEAACLPLVADANLRGMLIDVEAAKSLGNRLVDVSNDMLLRLGPHGITEKVVRSPTQLSKLMFETWGLPVLKQNVSDKTGKVTNSTDKEVLHELSFIDPRAAEIRLYREALGNKTKFVDAPLESVEYNEDGKTHPNAIVFGTYTSRMTYASKQGRNKDERQTGFAIHQEKRGADFRSLIVAPPGYTLMEYDASGQEVRWMAIASGDESMLSMCLPGRDLHTFMGSEIGHLPYNDLAHQLSASDPRAKELRQLGKVANLSCLSASTLVLTNSGYKPIVDVKAVDKVWDGYEWVSHRGVIFRGYKHVISYSSLTATADHQVLTKNGWVQLGEAAQHKLEICSAKGWHALRQMDGNLFGYVKTAAVQSRLSLRLWCSRRGVHPRPLARCQSIVSGLRGVCGHRGKGPTFIRRYTNTPAQTEVQRGASALYQPGAPGLQILRWAWDTVRVCKRLSDGAVRVIAGVIRRDRSAANRPNRQQRALRYWKPALSNKSTTVCQPQSVPENTQKQEAVYDILDCGPRNQFAANGLIVHNCQYRTSAKKLRVVARVQYGIPMELPEAEFIHATYQQTYKKVPVFWRNQIALTKRLGYVETFAGRRVQVVGNWRGTQGWSMESTSINYRIQGTGGDQKYLALSVLRPYITSIGAQFAWELHDGIYVYVLNHMVSRAAVEIKYLLDNLPYQKAWGFTPPIPLPWDVKSGRSWGELKEWSNV